MPSDPDSSGVRGPPRKRTLKKTPTAKAPVVAKQTAPSVPAKLAPRRPSVEVEEVYDEADHHTSVPPRNPRHILEATDGSDDDMEGLEDPAPELININNDDDDDEDVEVLEAPEESAEAELSTWHCSCVRDHL